MTNWFNKRFVKSKPGRPDSRSVGRRLWLAKAGAVAIEFALVAPVFLILVTGIIEVGRLLFIRSSLQFAVDEAARYALVQVTPDMAQVETRISGLIRGLDPSDVTFDASPVTDGDGNTYTLVTATYLFTPMIPLFDASHLGLDNINLSAQARVPQTLTDAVVDDF